MLFKRVLTNVWAMLPSPGYKLYTCLYIHVCTSSDVSNGFPFPQQTMLCKANTCQDRVNKLQLHCLGWGGVGVSLSLMLSVSVKTFDLHCVFFQQLCHWGIQTLILYRKITFQFCFSGCLKKDTLWHNHNISPTNTHVDGTHCFWWINHRQARHTLLTRKMINTPYTYWNMQWNP